MTYDGRYSHNEVATLVRGAILEEDPNQDLEPYKDAIYDFSDAYNGERSREAVKSAWLDYVLVRRVA